jgi:hypothetical protein
MRPYFKRDWNTTSKLSYEFVLQLSHGRLNRVEKIQIAPPEVHEQRRDRRIDSSQSSLPSSLNRA